MKIVRMFAAAGLVIASMGATTVAEAQHHRGNDRGHEQRYDRGHDRDHRGYRGNRGRAYGHNRRNRCHTEYRRHRQVRVCR